ncbi:MAG: exodeoxyribonuclease VII small subunit [Candidatus Algichlamydia australiensis]|nr:exodeoxyribonuclease VII small subunit [Chlamydiales bacterium]
MQNKNFSFETAYSRLEEILDKLNSGETPLDDSLKLYEEADGLIKSALGKLTTAEKKIEMLIKNRKGEPELTPYEPQNGQPLS